MKNLRFMPQTLWLLLLAFVIMPLASSAQGTDEKPLLTIGCTSDFHNEKSLVQTDDPTKVQLRGSVAKLFNKMGEEEDVDVILIGGDCSSEAEVTEAVWMAMKYKLVDVIRTAFKPGKRTPVLIATGNHDYELSQKDANGHRIFNSADYYNYPMKQDVGELAKGEYIMEDATRNGGTLNVMAAYHYKVYGFDFVALNCAKHSFASSGDYQYSMESVQWVADKLDEIYKDDPDKTVFFFLHIPFGDSNSIRFTDKGIAKSEAEHLLKMSLAKHPNLIMLYGHDHGGDQSYTRRTSAQRVTLYDTNGNVIPRFDATHVEGPTTDPENDFCNEHPKFTLYNEKMKKYVGISGGNLAPVDTKTHNITFTRNTTGNTYTCSIDDNSIHNGSSAQAFSEGEASPILMYMVDEYIGTNLAAHLTNDLQIDKQYFMVRKQNDTDYYVLYNSTASTGGMVNLKVNTNAAGDTILLPQRRADYCTWTLSAPREDHYYYIQSLPTGRYLNANADNLTTLEAQAACSVTLVGDEPATFNIATEHAGSESSGGRFLFSGTNGFFSCNNDPSELYLYEVTTLGDDNHVEAVRTKEITSGKTYVIVGHNKFDSALWYALTNKDYLKNATSHRVYPVEMQPDETISFTDDPEMSCLWTFTDATPEPGQPSFMSSFMGSTRHYLNGIDSGMIETGTPNIIQGLMIYVYKDRVVLQMKNYNKFGLCANGITVNEKLATYTSYREVKVPTDIHDVSFEDAYFESQQPNAPIYNLSGQRIQQPTHGIYIRDGKKYVVK